MSQQEIKIRAKTGSSENDINLRDSFLEHLYKSPQLGVFIVYKTTLHSFRNGIKI